MEKELFGIPNADVYLVIGITMFFIFLEVISGLWARSKRTLVDWVQELGGFMVLGFLTKPLIVLVVLFLSNKLIPPIQQPGQSIQFFRCLDWLPFGR